MKKLPPLHPPANTCWSAALHLAAAHGGDDLAPSHEVGLAIGIHTLPRSDGLAQHSADFSARFGFGGFGSAPGADQAQLIARTMRYCSPGG
jgi:hypothetical protein